MCVSFLPFSQFSFLVGIRLYCLMKEICDSPLAFTLIFHVFELPGGEARDHPCQEGTPEPGFQTIKLLLALCSCLPLLPGCHAMSSQDCLI